MKVRNGFLDLDGVPWRDEYVQEFEERGCAGVLVGPGHKGPPLEDAGFLTRIPGLRRVGFLKGVKDISVVSQLPGLLELNVASDYKGPLSLAGMTSLESLSMPFLPAVRELAGLTRLKSVMIYFWPRGEDLAILGPKPELEDLRLEFKRTVKFSSAPLAAAPHLRKLSLYDGALTDVAGLAALTEMRELYFYGTKIPSLSFVASMPHLDTMDVENGGEIDSVEPLRGHPALRSLGIAGKTNILSGDLTPLLDLPAAKAIALERGYPHYTHKPAQIRR